MALLGVNNRCREEIFEDLAAKSCHFVISDVGNNRISTGNSTMHVLIDSIVTSQGEWKYLAK